MAVLFRYGLPQSSFEGPRKPIAWVEVHGPRRFLRVKALLDTGADITVLPGWVATAIGFSLDQEPATFIKGIGDQEVPATVLPVQLELRGRGNEQYSWEAGVAFTLDRTNEFLLGQHGFLRYFDATFYGAKETAKLTWNNSYRDIRLRMS